uniref:Uncharacterized protein n=1 Tax=Anopheles dirus TaxID=7168 RepID=A0A182NX57_9DIPT
MTHKSIGNVFLTDRWLNKNTSRVLWLLKKPLKILILDFFLNSLQNSYTLLRPKLFDECISSTVN